MNILVLYNNIIFDSYFYKKIIKTIKDEKKLEKEIKNNLSIYLHEDFLKAFDKLRNEQKRKEGGVFYTPEPVIKFIVKSTRKILKEKFNISEFKNEKIKILDPATGTGGFLLEIFNTILENINSNSHASKEETIKKYFLNNIYGYELMFIPYMIAHLKLYSILKKYNYSLKENEKFNIFLTNTLDLSQENLDKLEEVKNINKENILIIVGNPPYNNKTKNKNKKLLELLKDYKDDLMKKKINLDDDYIKFIRFAQWKLLEQKTTNSGLFHL